MNHITTSWLTITLVLGVFAWLWGPYRAVFVAAWVIGSAIVMGALVAPLGWPVSPISYIAELPTGQLSIIGLKLVQDQAIYILVDGDEPRLFVLPWNQQQADALQSMADNPQGGGIKAQSGDALSLGGVADWPKPQPSRPEKEHPDVQSISP